MRGKGTSSLESPRSLTLWRPVRAIENSRATCGSRSARAFPRDSSSETRYRVRKTKPCLGSMDRPPRCVPSLGLGSSWQVGRPVGWKLQQPDRSSRDRRPDGSLTLAGGQWEAVHLAAILGIGRKTGVRHRLAAPYREARWQRVLPNPSPSVGLTLIAPEPRATRASPRRPSPARSIHRGAA